MGGGAIWTPSLTGLPEGENRYTLIANARRVQAAAI
jgi:hypothetical protein